MKIEIPLEPKAQKRPRASFKGNRITVHEDKDMRAWRRKVTGYLQRHYKGDCYSSAIKVDLTFYMKAPKSISDRPTPRSKEKRWNKFKRFVSELIWHTKRPDIDNLSKAVLDSVSDAKKGLNEPLIWTDDNIVCELHARKLYSPNPRIVLEIEEVEDEE